MIGGLVEREQIGFLPQRRGDLQALALAVAQAGPSRQPFALDPQHAAPSTRRAVTSFCKGEQVGRWSVGALIAQMDAGWRSHGTAERLQPPGGEPEQRALARAIGTDDGRPPRREVQREAVDHELGLVVPEIDRVEDQ